MPTSAQIEAAVLSVAQDKGLLHRLNELYRKRKRYDVDWQQGGCLVFAKAIHRVLGGQPIHVWTDVDDGDPFTSHIGIRLTSEPSLVLDSDGFTPTDEWLNKHRLEKWEDDEPEWSVIRIGWPEDIRRLFYDAKLLASIVEKLKAALSTNDRQLGDLGSAARSIFDKARAFYGLTDNPYDAGYILPDGSMLDFSDGGGMGRAVDHRNIGVVYPRSDDEPYVKMHRFVAAGAIRMAQYDMFDRGRRALGFSAYRKPTREQLATIRSFVRAYQPAWFLAERVSKDGYELTNETAEDRPSADVVAALIDEVWSEGRPIRR